MLVFSFIAVAAQGQGRITSPKEQFGFTIGDDYVLANYTQYVDYLKKLDAESDRMTVEEIGTSSEGRPIYLAIITSPENHKDLARYKEISQRLSRAEGLTDDQARALAADGKAVVWIDGGIHATEVLGAQQLIENIYQLVSRTDPETLRFLNDVIVLNCLVNPDGMELVSDWYMREPEPTRRSTENIPRLYNKYAGHDDNRDFYMTALSESEAINRVLYRDWFPQIVYNHHQTGPAGAVMFSPPFRDPFNFFYDPLVMTELDEVGGAMHSRFALEEKPGVTSRSGANYSTWWNGGLRTSPYFHNQIGLLTETIGNPTPTAIPFVLEKSLPKNDLPFPITPQPLWHFRQSIDYSITANRAVIDYASRNRDRLLFNIYRMGMNSIERGNRDSWTTTPRRIEQVQAQATRDRVAAGRGGTIPARYFDGLRDRSSRDPRGYVIPSDQPDFLTATKFVNALIKNGVAIQRATASFSANGKTYPAGSYVVKTAQAFRPHVLDMFEPQDHPDDFPYPGAPPTPPYDSAGWTLAYQMGVKFDRILDGFDGPFEKLQGEVKPPAGRITEVGSPAGYLLSHDQNDSFIAVNRLLNTSEEVYWVKTAFTANGKAYPAGTHFILAKSTTLAKLQKMAQEIGVSFEAMSSKPGGEALRLRPRRIGLWDRTGGSVPSGWTRYVLEKFEFPFTVIYGSTIDAGELAQRFDVLIFADDGVTSPTQQLKKFLQDGGTILAIGGSTSLAYRLELPISDALAQALPDGRINKLPATEFYVPGSVLQAKVDNANPLAFGMPERADFFFENSPAFRVPRDAEKKGVKVIAWYDSSTPLRSGWAWGQKYLENTAAVVEASVGKGKLFLFGPEILFRSQPHGTYKLLFNGIYYGRAETVSLN
ncbi:MAG TPA: M14 family metallopeptidase [Terriglobia bacterium]|nr:M14 family metallopeptidase [Terriglobia bacterium]